MIPRLEEGGVRVKGARPARLKVLLFLRRIDYDRVFGDILRALLGRGHEVLVALEHKGGPPRTTIELFDELREGYSGFDQQQIRPRRGVWRILASAIRRSLDYLWLLEPEHAGADHLRGEARDVAPRVLRALLFLPPFRWRSGRRLLGWLLRRLEAGMPISRSLKSFIKGEAPDVVLASPVVEFDPVHGDFIRTAEAATLPSVLVVVSWDDLAAKRVWDIPTLAVVCNGEHVNEAVRLHGLPRERIVPVGAQSFNGHEAPAAPGAVEAIEHASSAQMFPRREGRLLRPILWLLTPLVAVVVALLRPRATVRAAIGLVRRAGRWIRKRTRRLRRSLRQGRTQPARAKTSAAKEERARHKRERARHTKERARRKPGERGATRAARAEGDQTPKRSRSGSDARQRRKPSRKSASRRTLRALRRRWKYTRRGIRRIYNRRYRLTYRRTIRRVPSRDELPALLNARGLFGRGAEVGVKAGRYSDELLSNWRGDELISIDPWLSTDPEEYVDRSNVSQDEFDRFYQQTRERLERHGDRSAIWRMTSVEAALKVPDRSLDFVYIDARHDYESVKEDVAAWCSKVRPGGILAGHDYVDGDLPEGEFHVKSAVDEFFGARDITVHATEGPSAVESFPTWIVEVPEDGISPTSEEKPRGRPMPRRPPRSGSATMLTSGHVQELAEVKALTYELNESTQVVLERITEARRQLVPRGPLLAFVHIPKTAGGTAKTMLQRAYSKPALHSAGNYVRGPEKTVKKVAKPAGGWERWHEKGGRVTIGHVPYGVFRDHLPAGTRYMTFLREPVDRVLSHYYRHVHHPELSAAHRMGRRQRGRETAGSIEEALSDLHVPQLRNLATRFLCGHPSPMGELSASAVDDAKENLREFAFVGIQERFDESMVLLQRMLGLGLIPYLNVHVSLEGRRPTAEEISDEQRALIEEHNTLDAELYRFGLELFEEAVAAREDGFAADAEALPALSAKANEEAFQRARDWLDRELPVGSAREPGELRSAAKAAGITVPALKRALSVSSVRKRDQAGHRVWTRVDGTRGVAESSGRSYV